MTTREIADIYISFFEKREHKRIPNASLVPLNDPTTLFTSSGMQPLVPYLLGEEHPQGKRLVNVQNCFRAQDIDEVGDNRHTTFFRMLGNWSLGDYFKSEQLPWFFEFLTKELQLDPQKLYVTVFKGNEQIEKDETSAVIWKQLFTEADLNPDEHIFYYGVEKNWWSRSGTPDKMPVGEPGGPDSEVFYKFDVAHDKNYGEECHPNCDCGAFMEIGNSVFMQYLKTADGFTELPKRNVDFGGGLERLLAASENQSDVFQTTLFSPIIKALEQSTGKDYASMQKEMRIITDHFVSATFITANNVIPSNKEQGYILRRLIRRGLDNLYKLEGKNIEPILEAIVEQYSKTDPDLVEKFETIQNVVLEEQQKYEKSRTGALGYLSNKYPTPITVRGDEIMGKLIEISPMDAFNSLASYGTAPTQLKSLGYTFDEQKLAEIIKQHQETSRKGATQKFHGGLADHQEKTIIGHTATHLLHQALRDVLGNQVHQTGSNITTTRVRFDFNHDQKLTDEQIQQIEEIMNRKIEENLPVHYEMMSVDEAKKIGAIGLFEEKYGEKVKVYFIGDYSKEFCGGPHVDFTGVLKRIKIIKQENLGHQQRRIYATVG